MSFIPSFLFIEILTELPFSGCIGSLKKRFWNEISIPTILRIENSLSSLPESSIIFFFAASILASFMYEEVLSSVPQGNVLSPYSALKSNKPLISLSKLPACIYLVFALALLSNPIPTCDFGSFDIGFDIACLSDPDSLAGCELLKSLDSAISCDGATSCVFSASCCLSGSEAFSDSCGLALSSGVFCAGASSFCSVPAA